MLVWLALRLMYVCMHVRLLICTLLGISAAIFWQTLDRQRAM